MTVFPHLIWIYIFLSEGLCLHAYRHPFFKNMLTQPAEPPYSEFPSGNFQPGTALHLAEGTERTVSSPLWEWWHGPSDMNAFSWVTTKPRTVQTLLDLTLYTVLKPHPLNTEMTPKALRISASHLPLTMPLLAGDVSVMKVTTLPFSLHSSICNDLSFGAFIPQSLPVSPAEFNVQGLSFCASNRLLQIHHYWLNDDACDKILEEPAFQANSPNLWTRWALSHRKVGLLSPGK